MLLQSVDVVSARFLSNKAVVVNSIDVLFTRNCITETSAGAVSETYTPCFVAERLLDVRSCVYLIVEPA